MNSSFRLFLFAVMSLSLIFSACNQQSALPGNQNQSNKSWGKVLNLTAQASVESATSCFVEQHINPSVNTALF